MNSTQETRDVNLRLLYLDEMKRVYFTHVSCLSTKGDACCVRAPPVSQLKETLAVNPCLLCLDEKAKFWGPLVNVTGFYTARYIGGMIVTGFLNEVRYFSDQFF
jgi:hypothetical protein